MRRRDRCNHRRTSAAADGRAHDNVSARTGADGRFTLAGLQHGTPHVLVVAAQGLGRALLDFDPPTEPRGEVDLGDVVLREDRAIEGVAVDGDGRPIAGAFVSLADANDTPDHLRRVLSANLNVYEQRRTDDLGRFRITDIAAGSYRLWLYVPDSQPTSRRPCISVVVPPERNNRLRPHGDGARGGRSRRAAGGLGRPDERLPPWTRTRRTSFR